MADKRPRAFALPPRLAGHRPTASLAMLTRPRASAPRSCLQVRPASWRSARRRSLRSRSAPAFCHA